MERTKSRNSIVSAQSVESMYLRYEAPSCCLHTSESHICHAIIGRKCEISGTALQILLLHG